MKKYIFLLFLLWAVDVTGAEILDAKEEGSDATRNNSDYVMGQSFVPSISGTLSRVSIQTNSSSTVSMSLRIGTSNNLTSYTEEITRDVNTSGNPAWVDFTSVSTPAFVQGNTYYLGIYAPTGGPSTSINESGAYSGGSYYYSDTPNFNLSGNVATRDLTFRVYINEESAAGLHTLTTLGAGK